MQRLAVAQEVFFEIVHQAHDLIEHFLICRTLHQQPFRSEDFRNLRQNRGAAPRGDPVGDAPDERIRADAAEPVGAAAFDADAERFDSARLAPIAFGDLHELLDCTQAGLCLIRLSLCREGAHARALRIRQLGQQRLELIRFAAEPDDQHAARIRVLRKRRDEPARAVEIAAELRAAELMRKCMHAVDAICEPRIREASDPLGRPADTADRTQNPDFVARADAAVRTPVSQERTVLSCDLRRIGSERFEAVAVEPRKQRLHVVRVDVGTDTNLRRRAPDRPAVSAHRLAGATRSHRELVAARDRIEQGDRGGTDLHVLAPLQILERDRDVIVRRDSQGERGSYEGGRHDSILDEGSSVLDQPGSRLLMPHNDKPSALQGASVMCANRSSAARAVVC